MTPGTLGRTLSMYATAVVNSACHHPTSTRVVVLAVVFTIKNVPISAQYDCPTDPDPDPDAVGRRS